MSQFRKVSALERYWEALEKANAEISQLREKVGGVFELASEEVFQSVVKPAYQKWDAQVAAAFAAYQQEVPKVEVL